LHGALPLDGYDGSMINDGPQTRRAVSRRSPFLPLGLIRRNDAPGSRLGMCTRAPTVVGISMLLLGGCAQTNHYLIHPRDPAPEVVVWSADFARDQIQVHIEGARPPGVGPFPTVLVLPEEDEEASDMHGVIWDLAARGYLAIAADFRRWIDGKYRRNSFAWRSSADLTLIVDVTRAYPEADQTRIGALGFSEGAVVSLLMAAHDPDRIKAVVAYYPITDFPRWFAGERSDLLPRLLFGLARWQLRVDSGAPNDAEFDKMLRLASPFYMAEYIRAPVLLVHGAQDTLAPPDESERMAERLAASGDITKLLIVPGGERLFNFRQPQQATLAWDATLEWLDRYLRSTPPATGEPRLGAE
jgi:dienelactone hydrolase